MKKMQISHTSKLVLLTIIYFITGKIGLEIEAVSGFATFVWFPTGISLVALFLGGYRLWPGIFLGAFFVNLVTGAPFFPAISIAIGNTLEAVVGTYILTRFVGFQTVFERVRDVIGLTLFAGPISAIVSATIGVTSLWLAHIVPSNTIGQTWLAWWIGDVLSDIVISPFLFIWLRKFAFKRKKQAISIENAILVTVAVFFSWFIFTRPPGPPLAYLIYPLLIWAGLRSNARVVITMVFIISMVGIWNTIHEMGPFLRQNPTESLLFLQIYIGIISVSSLIFTAIMSERNRLEQRKNDFISMASHELKTPVTSMKLYIDILSQQLKRYEDPKSTQIIANVKKQITNLTGIVSDLLDVSRIQTERLQYNMEDFYIDELIQEVMESLQLSTKKQRFIYKNDHELTVHADRFRIYQVLTNLLTNAVKYSKGGDIIIKTTKQKNKIVVSVQDFGVGISEDQQKRIFDQFYQASDPKDKTFPGLGMGLYISKEIVNRHGGDIWVKSEKGRGSTFFFTLPVVTLQTL